MNAGIVRKTLPSGANVFIYHLSIINIHTYVAPEDSFGTATHIIETPNYLMIVDSQYMVPYSKEFRDYADSLDKTIAGIIISHPHPDHYFGLSAGFSDILSYAFPEIIEEIRTNGPVMLKESKKQLKDLVPDKITIPTNTLHTGTIVLDGVTIKYKKYQKAEAEVQTVIELPELNVLIIQDLVSNRYHPWLGKNSDHWIDDLENIRLEHPNTNTLFVGHGNPSSLGGINRMIDYLSKTESIRKEFSNNNKKIQEQIIQKFPNYKGRQIIPMWLEYS